MRVVHLSSPAVDVECMGLYQNVFFLQKILSVLMLVNIIVVVETLRKCQHAACRGETRARLIARL